MHQTLSHQDSTIMTRALARCSVLTICAAVLLLPGCASLTNPTANAVPVNRLPTEILGESREIEQTIPEKFLKAPKQDPYLLSANDVLGIFIRGITGDEKTIPPVVTLPDTRLPPSFGFPFVIREDGTVSLPLAPEPIKVSGMSVAQAEKEIKRYFVDVWQILKAENASVSVSLQKQHTNAIFVLRQDSGSVTFGGGGLNNTKRGTGVVLELQYNESDVATALTRTGGLPGIDAKNEVLIFRGVYKSANGNKLVMPDLKALKGGKTVLTRDADGKPGLEVVRIPLRLKPGSEVPFTPEEMRLGDGDALFIETRETELFYTGGLLPPSEIVLPRDYDLDVLEAVAQVRGPLFNGGQATSSLVGNSIVAGMGSPSPTCLTIVRRWPEGKSVIIRVNLAKALTDPRERILVKPGDFLILQETFGESFARYLTQTANFNYASTLLNNSPAGTITLQGRAP